MRVIRKGFIVLDKKRAHTQRYFAGGDYINGTHYTAENLATRQPSPLKKRNGKKMLKTRKKKKKETKPPQQTIKTLPSIHDSWMDECMDGYIDG